MNRKKVSIVIDLAFCFKGNWRFSLRCKRGFIISHSFFINRNQRNRNRTRVTDTSEETLFDLYEFLFSCLSSACLPDTRYSHRCSKWPDDQKGVSLSSLTETRAPCVRNLSRGRHTNKVVSLDFPGLAETPPHHNDRRLCIPWSQHGHEGLTQLVCGGRQDPGILLNSLKPEFI